MSASPRYLHRNTRAMLLGVSLLLMSASAAELRELGVDRDILQQADSQALAQTDPLLLQQLIAGLSLLSYGEQEQRYQQIKRLSALTEGAGQALSATVTLNTPYQQLDRRIDLAESRPAHLSGSSSILL